MTSQHPPHRFIPFTNIVTDVPVLMIDSHAPLRDLHACVSERLHTVLNYLTLMACTNLPDYAERDINTVTNVARLMIQDISDVFGVIEQRGLEPK
ncbi:fructose-bisphosphate aldolase [Pseudomonas sp. H11T01]|uniref:fructose-bisphosphate aldolase n=1 Tax=Pseudomonas sp. H11T01 TaxID=3402749 RepID=UPI003AD79A8B